MKKLGEKFRKIIQSEFARNVLTLTSGTAFAQVIPLLLAPILSRIYSPEDFGRLALYLSIVQILGAVSSGRYELAIMLPKEKKNGVQLTLLAIIITMAVSFTTLIVVLFFSKGIANSLGDPKLSEWLFFVPLSVLLMGIFNALNYFNTREKEFKNIAKANVFKSLGGNGGQLVLGLVKYTSGGLIIGQLASHFFGNLRMAKTFLRNTSVIKRTDCTALKELASRYSDFPKFSMWGVFLNTTSVNLTNFFVSSFYSLNYVGFYSYSTRYIGLPISLIGNSIGQVFFQKLSEERNNGQKAYTIFKSTFKKLALLGSIIFLPAFFIIEDAFVLVFGERWETAGQFARLLIPLYYLRFIFGPLSLTNIVYEKQKLALLCQMLIMAGHLIVLFSAWYFDFEITNLLLLQVGVLGGVYLYLFFILKSVVKGKI
ncbi:lipopolysaccharide biosynthesis protein [Pseudozobellia thermophila]|uniref:Membrane protein involved in the export of O-antigen and teichoic acid n=1 Tax=Pseudozobellia thermophila TaxID=192903 RepID=A0A1M6BM68_9FLAO|nr:oligosaccharide flippase family protein [Pseudozobellia thermophila]SHI49757.1 Membrane protein involved in the export of O-antigen and teichoic acid [Pseudozobellia thermophila]